ncbi:MAG: hypothetical protein GYA51_11730 [Candidatus Methanofastidiosa archaeon]|nr:hypothetical protein [Candidatus Methanofastidiosa archaeon]
MKIRVLILSNEVKNDHVPWIKACQEYKNLVNFRVVNLTANKWFEEISKEPVDILVAKPSGFTSPFKQLYDERIFILASILGYQIFPSPTEIFLYENKRLLSFWLKANNIQHPSTHVFYDYSEAYRFVETTKFPIVAKTNIGAAGSGVQILRDNSETYRYLKSSFFGRGAYQRIGPNFEKGGLLLRGMRYFSRPWEAFERIKIYKSLTANIQKGFVILQEYIPHDFEWRVVRIGESFFAHKKVKKGEKASGTLLKEYVDPPKELLDLVASLTERFHFYSQAIDIFESPRGYLINEMQCIFGQSDPYQMLVNNKPGRYLMQSGKWCFEEGDFARNSCYNLRLEHIINVVNSFKQV